MDNTKYLKARERVIEIKIFYGKVSSALFTIAIVASINYYLNEWQYPWFLWVVFGLGISLFIKANKRTKGILYTPFSLYLGECFHMHGYHYGKNE